MCENMKSIQNLRFWLTIYLIIVPFTFFAEGQLDVTNGKRISQRKCEEFSKYATEESYFTPLLLDGPTFSIEVSECKYDTPLIVGGEEAQLAEFPHMAAIGWNSTGNNEIEWGCGGVLISEEFVLTAAHCSLKHIPEYVRLGDHDLIKVDEGAQPQQFKIREIMRHPEFHVPIKYNDIALIRLEGRAKLGKFVRPACLWQSPSINYTQAIATGWGQIEYSGPRSDFLLKVSLNITSNELCNQQYEITRALPKGIAETQLCAGFDNKGKDTCQGDSGGPIQVVTPDNTCIFHILGIVSTGKFCGSANTPGIYTRISSYLNWIESIVWP
ncbi:serine protease snake-like isoform X2 [Lutzomyia longipalpis]|uniref:serine protease snake-like isoform X2 n=1 Tax=Lutzomyia longipalpis TaxID=7200 RepID=UPI00248334FF|nr:serine protease snake-like isoform X2 [Lutzomyia longipalpis]